MYSSSNLVSDLNHIPLFAVVTLYYELDAIKLLGTTVGVGYLVDSLLYLLAGSTNSANNIVFLDSKTSIDSGIVILSDYSQCRLIFSLKLSQKTDIFC